MNSETNSNESSWIWDHEEKYGVIKNTENKSLNEGSDLIIVFVHGILGDCKSTWGSLPKFLLKESKLFCDVFSYQYPSGFGQNASIEKASEDLLTYLRKVLRKYEHYIFITHSTGGLVVKQMFVGDKKSNTGIAQSPDEIIDKTRLVVNVTVPHYGSTINMSRFVLQPINFIGRVFQPMAELLQILVNRYPAFGYNRIPSQLVWKNKFLVQLESLYQKMLANRDKIEHPKTTIIEILANDDVAVPNDVHMNNSEVTFVRTNNQAVKEKIFFRGSHFSIKLPLNMNDPVVQSVSDLLSGFSDDASLSIALHTFIRTKGIDDTLKIQWDNDFDFVQNADMENLSRRFTDCVPGVQAVIFSKLIDDLTTNKSVRSVLILGDGLVGKSTIIRRAARYLAASYLESPRQDALLPIVVPMKLVVADEEALFREPDSRRSFKLRKIILDFWVKWAKSVSGNDSISTSYLRNRVKNCSYVLFLDGVDEFLRRHDRISVDMFNDLVKLLNRESFNHMPFKIVLVFRSTQKGLAALLPAFDSAYEVLSPSMLQIKGSPRYKELSKLIDNVSDPVAKELLIKPISTTWLGFRASELLEKKSCRTSADVFTEILISMLKDYLDQSPCPNNFSLKMEDWINAMTLIGARFFFNHVAELEVSNLANRICADVEGNGSFLPDAVKLLKNEVSFQILIGSAAFIGTNGGRFRVSHEELELYFYSRYLYLAICSRRYDLLRVRAFTASSFRMAAQMVPSEFIDVNVIKEVIKAWKESDDVLIVGNFFGFLGHARPSLDSYVFEYIAENVREMPVVAQLVLCSSFGLWALTTPLVYIKKRLLGMYIKIWKDPEIVRDPIIKSVVWCHITAISKKCNEDVDVGDWPSLSLSNKSHIEAALNILGRKEQSMISYFRSLQIAFADMQQTVLIEEDRPMSAIHYLFCLVAVSTQGSIVHEAELEISEIVNSRSPHENEIAKKYANYHMPQVRELLIVPKVLA